MAAESRDARAPEFHATPPDDPIYRIARSPDPWAWPDWSFGTLNNRWDDSQKNYRVLYASSNPLGALMDVLARFRPDLHIIEALKEIEDDEGGDVQLPGELDVSWLSNRCLGVARPVGEFFDVGHSASLAHLRVELAGRAVHYGLDDLDAAAIRLSVPRDFTQEISRYVYDLSTPEEQRRFAGIMYLSRLGDDFRNWAIFESPEGALPWAEQPEIRPIQANDPDLQQALKRLGVWLTGA